MTAPDLAAVCERHGIDCVPADVEGTGWYARTPVHGIPRHAVTAATQTDAVCGILKERYRIDARSQGNARAWMARVLDKPLPTPVVWHSNELSAVIACANAQLTPTPAAGC